MRTRGEHIFLELQRESRHLIIKIGVGFILCTAVAQTCDASAWHAAVESRARSLCEHRQGSFTTRI